MVTNATASSWAFVLDVNARVAFVESVSLYFALLFTRAEKAILPCLCALSVPRSMVSVLSFSLYTPSVVFLNVISFGNSI